MKLINNFITEKLRIGKSINPYNYFPKTGEELRKILEERLAEDKNADLNDINVSAIIDMGEINAIGLFEELDPHNIDISTWDVSRVTNMKYMFYGCENFNSDLSKWDVSNVTNTRFMFYNCENFNSDLSKWDVSKVRKMGSMFYGCKSFNSDLSNWNVSNVDSMNRIFDGCKSLKNKPSWYWYT